MSIPPEIFYGVGAALLLAGIGYGAWRAGRRNRRNDPIREAATHELYKHPERYEERTREELEDKLEPE